MALTLRPARLSRDPDARDYTVHADGAEIGRLYEDDAPTRPENRWFWSITLLGAQRGRLPDRGRAGTLEAAKADFAQAWATWQAWRP